MSFNRHQFRDLIERRLKERGLHSEAAVNLLMGTAAQESRLGTYLRQVRGPALGVFQMEPATFNWLRDRYEEAHPELKGREAPELEWDLDLAILTARLRYRIDPHPLPAPMDVEELARTWKRVYNTASGAGKPEEFVRNFWHYAAPPKEE